MAVKTLEPNKYFIENYILTEDSNPSKWSDNDLIELTNNHNIIGYLFSTKKGAFGELVKTLNLYLINRKYCCKNTISLNELQKAYDYFLDLNKIYPELSQHAKRNVFKNPPINEWFKTKENWCKKLALSISEFNKLSFPEAISQINYTVCRLYAKKHVYMGNLGYIQTAVFNDLKIDHRKSKHLLTFDNDNVVSLQSIVGRSKDGDEVTLEETIGTEDKAHKERDYKDFEDDCRRLLKPTFSDREIDQIFTQKPSFLPFNIYNRLLKWRIAHYKELQELKSQL